jgi:hypothetical protein
MHADRAEGKTERGTGARMQEGELRALMRMQVTFNFRTPLHKSEEREVNQWFAIGSLHYSQ